MSEIALQSTGAQKASMSESNEEPHLRVAPEGAPGKGFLKIEGFEAQCIATEAANAHLKMPDRNTRQTATSEKTLARTSIKLLQL
jgi:hypothetical protein